MKSKKSRQFSARNSGGAPITERERDLKFSYPFRIDFPQQFSTICNLKPIKRWIANNSVEDFQLKLGPVIYGHRMRYQDSNYQTSVSRSAIGPLPSQFKKSKSIKPTKFDKPINEIDRPYFSRIKDCMVECGRASEALLAVFETFRFIDLTHVEQIQHVATLLPRNPLDSLNMLGILNRLGEMSQFADALAISIQIATGLKSGGAKRGEHGYRYILPTMELMDLWEEVTGTRVVTPRGAKATGNSIGLYQDSSRFVEIGLSMIDTDSSPTKTITAIRNVFQIRKEIEDTTLENFLATEMTRRK